MKISCVRAQVLHWINIKINRVLDFYQEIVGLQNNNYNVSQVFYDCIHIDLIIGFF